jgi:hypothetical protein
MGVLVVGLLKGGSYMRREELWKAITNVHHAIVNTKYKRLLILACGEMTKLLPPRRS